MRRRRRRRRKKCLFPYWLSLVRMAGSYEKTENRERERIYALDEKKRNIYIQKRRHRHTYSSSYCLDIGALIFTTMYQLPSYYLHDMITSIVSFEQK